jgi:hypothetical protein
MNVNRSNYEIWLIDLLEGNLSEKEAEVVTIFLKMNPDIREEFDNLSSSTLELPKEVFQNKKKIQKLVADIPESQFEILCAAYVENDLQAESKAELHKIADSARERMRTFKLISRTKLIPPSIVYKHKNLLLRTTPLQRVIRLAAIGLSSAAAITLFVIIFLAESRSLKDNSGNSAQVFPAYTKLKEQYFEIRAENAIRVYPKGIVPKEKRYIPVPTFTSELSQSDTTQTNAREVLLADVQISPLPPVAINRTADFGLGEDYTSSLIALNNTVTLPPDMDDMSNVGRFITKIFREKILREKVASETPLKGYEIAEAGVAGLNLLFGWEMALNEKNDENGELTSVSFSSKILKFNAPVKKTAPQ